MSSNDDMARDSEDNICLSFVVDEDNYYVILYPSPNKSSMQEFYAKAEKELREEKHGKEHLRLGVLPLVWNNFSTTHGFALGDFMDAYTPGQPFQLLAVIDDGKTKPVIIDAIRPITKRHVKMKPSVELTREEIEYDLWHKVITRSRKG